MAGSFPFPLKRFGMLAKRWWLWAVVFCFCLPVVAGCGSQGTKGENNGYDRPKKPDKT